jgi:hypothetical protein
MNFSVKLKPGLKLLVMSFVIAASCGCQAFKMTDAQFEKQQRGQYDESPKATQAWTQSAPAIEFLMQSAAAW